MLDFMVIFGSGQIEASFEASCWENRLGLCLELSRGLQ